jgi:selenocysteine lyase/cysteine desulfurase
VNSVLHANQERYFNCAFIARPSAGLIEDAYSAREWPEVINEAREKIALTLDPPESDRSPRSADRYVSLFANTTSALTRVLAQVQRGFADSRPTLLATDLEYPGCVAAINDCWNAPVVMARVARRLSEDIERADDHLHDALTRAFNVLKPRVVLVSHVARTTGQMLSPRTLRYFREANPRAVLIVDGSQAAGNVVVDADILDQCDFYISSGHKWLGGIPTSGFVWHAEEDRWEVDDQAQSVAFRGQQQAGGSGNAAAWASLSASLTEMAGDRPRTNLIARAKEIRHLAAVFRERLAEVPGVRFLTPTVRGRSLNGIITLTLPRDADRTLEEALRGRGYEHSTLEREQVRWRGSRATRFLLDWAPGHPVVEHATEYTETWSQRAHRFCFHYWHCEADVVALAEHVKDHVTSAAAHGPRAATQPTMP